jgi:hypothetical protein
LEIPSDVVQVIGRDLSLVIVRQKQKMFLMNVNVTLDICATAESCPHDFRPTSRSIAADVDSDKEMTQNSSDAIDINQT